MVKKWIKFVRKQYKKEDILSAVDKIRNGNFYGLDITTVYGKEGYYRCRIGKIRILFFEKDNKYYIDEVGMRGNIYKKL